MDTNEGFVMMGTQDTHQSVTGKSLYLQRRRRMGIEPTHRGLNPEHWI
jgi:hypothetical protein